MPAYMLSLLAPGPNLVEGAKRSNSITATDRSEGRINAKQDQCETKDHSIGKADTILGCMNKTRDII